jgi:hypothetical protein
LPNVVTSPVLSGSLSSYSFCAGFVLPGLKVTCRLLMTTLGLPSVMNRVR